MKSYVTAFFSRPINFDSFCGASKSTFFLPGQPPITEPLITNNDPLLIKPPTKLPLAFLPLSHSLPPLADHAHPPQSWAGLCRAEPCWAEPQPPGESPGEGVSRQILTVFPGFLLRQVFAENPLRTAFGPPSPSLAALGSLSNRRAPPTTPERSPGAAGKVWQQESRQNVGSKRGKTGEV